MWQHMPVVQQFSSALRLTMVVQVGNFADEFKKEFDRLDVRHPLSLTTANFGCVLELKLRMC